MNYYEKVIIFDANLDDTGVTETVEKIKAVISKHGGEVFKSESWGRRKLAYVLNKHEKGNYYIMQFKSKPTVVAELEKVCRVIDTVLKFMVVRFVKKKQIEAMIPSPAEAVKAEAEPTDAVKAEEPTDAVKAETEPTEAVETPAEVKEEPASTETKDDVQ